MLSRNLGQSGISISAIGLGCMGLSEFYGKPTQESDAINLLHRAVELGVTHFDTAEIYGQGHNEQLLGRGMLTGRYTSISDRPTSETDFRAQMQPRFQPGNIESNLKLVEAVKEIAAQKGCAAAQVALAWVLDQGDHVAAIPGTTKLANLLINVGALDCILTEENRVALNELAGQVLGDRYTPEGMASVNQ